MESKVNNLVICSTLNQITNFLIIEKYKPKKIYNITFKKDDIERLNVNIKANDWDKWLKDTCDKFKIKPLWESIELSIEQVQNFKKLKKLIDVQILKKSKGEIYWHITGGQRTIALAISELIGGRKEDKLIYVEGNTEKLIVNDNNGNIVPGEDLNYGRPDLTFQTVLNLVGFKNKKLESTLKFKEKGKIADHKDDQFNEEHEFYMEIYKIIEAEGNKEMGKQPEKIEFGCNGKKKDTFRKLLLFSNEIKNTTTGKNTKDNLSERTKFVMELFKKVKEKYKDIQSLNYNICESHEIYGSYPAGYIFEKIAAHKIYDIVKNNCKVIGMESSLKVYFEEKDNIADELDIALLTDTGKIINFECKSGGMKGDNAKSNKYTTYRLAGMFGMPVLLSPLYRSETRDKNIEFKSQLQAVNAAEMAELEVITIDEINETRLKRFLV